MVPLIGVVLLSEPHMGVEGHVTRVDMISAKPFMLFRMTVSKCFNKPAPLQVTYIIFQCSLFWWAIKAPRWAIKNLQTPH